jgi:hypothetical protein
LSPAAPEQLELVKKGLLAVLPSHNLKFDAGTDMITGEGPWQHGVKVKGVLPIIGAAVKAGPGFDEATIKQASNDFITDMTGLLNRRNQPPDRAQAPAQAPSGMGPGAENVQQLPNQVPPKFTPAKAIVGEWHSLREVNESYTTQINHTPQYYETMAIRKDGTLTWVIYRQGAALSNDEFKWKYNSGTGELVLSYPTGQPYQTLHVETADRDPGNLYFRTPNVDRLKVFGPATAPPAAQ